MTVLERFLKYISIDTTSQSEIDNFPSNKNEFVLAKLLLKELKGLGIKDIYYDKENCYIYALIKGNDELPKIGFIAHMDTSEDAKGFDIKPRLIENYDGKDINLNDEITMKVSDFPDLKNHLGKTLVVTDGNTLLGADDKAGIAEIMTMAEYFSKTKEMHGDIYIGFNPDEEIGKGLDRFDYKRFKTPIAYTVDGSDLGEISYENFNAATAKIEISGVSSHCGTAKGVMVNAVLIANAIMSSLPDETPANTEGYEGFFHIEEVDATVTKAKLKYLIRDFDSTNFEKRKQLLEEIVEKLNEKYDNRIKLTIKDSYKNMKELIEKDMSVVELPIKAMESIGITPIIKPIRGGTDGTDATYNGLLCPNLGTGGHNFHGVYEYIAVEDMEKTTEVLISMVKENNNRKVLQKAGK